jgi:hypothetical protein
MTFIFKRHGADRAPPDVVLKRVTARMVRSIGIRWRRHMTTGWQNKRRAANGLSCSRCCGCLDARGNIKSRHSDAAYVGWQPLDTTVRIRAYFILSR